MDFWDVGPGKCVRGRPPLKEERERDEEKEHEAADALCDIYKNGNGLHPGVKLDFYAMKGCN